MRSTRPTAENEYENWGAGIPPGVYDRKDLAIRYDVEDHGDIEIFKQNLIQFRKWMKWRGYRDKPLIVTEFGILMRPDYPAGDGRVYDHEFVREFMFDSFDFMRTAKDAEFGYPADGNRLVQSWAWFALNNVVDDGELRLLQRQPGQPRFRLRYAPRPRLRRLHSKIRIRTRNTSIWPCALSPARPCKSPPAARASASPSAIRSTTAATSRAPGARLRFWLGDPDSGGTLLTGRSSVRVRFPALPRSL